MANQELRSDAVRRSNFTWLALSAASLWFCAAMVNLCLEGVGGPALPWLTSCTRWSYWTQKGHLLMFSSPEMGYRLLAGAALLAAGLIQLGALGYLFSAYRRKPFSGITYWVWGGLVAGFLTAMILLGAPGESWLSDLKRCEQWYRGWLACSALVTLSVGHLGCAVAVGAGLEFRRRVEDNRQRLPTETLVTLIGAGTTAWCAYRISAVVEASGLDSATVPLYTFGRAQALWLHYSPLIQGKQEILCICSAALVVVVAVETGALSMRSRRFCASLALLASGCVFWFASRAWAARANEPVHWMSEERRTLDMTAEAEHWNEGAWAGIPALLLSREQAWAIFPRRVTDADAHSASRITPMEFRRVLEAHQRTTSHARPMAQQLVALLVDPELPLREAFPYVAAAHAAGYAGFITFKQAVPLLRQRVPGGGVNATFTPVLGRLSAAHWKQKQPLPEQPLPEQPLPEQPLPDAPGVECPPNAPTDDSKRWDEPVSGAAWEKGTTWQDYAQRFPAIQWENLPLMLSL